MRKSEKEFGFITHQRQSSRDPEKKLNDLYYADDIAMLEMSISGAHEQLNETSKNAKEVGLEINLDKTKLMVLNTGTQHSININDESIEIVDEFKYLGSQMS